MSLSWLCRCCNTCDDVKEAYRQKGWAFRSPEKIEQCHRDGFVGKLAEQKNEGCRVFGYLEVNRVGHFGRISCYCYCCCCCCTFQGCTKQKLGTGFIDRAILSITPKCYALDCKYHTLALVFICWKTIYCNDLNIYQKLKIMGLKGLILGKKDFVVSNCKNSVELVVLDDRSVNWYNLQTNFWGDCTRSVTSIQNFQATHVVYVVHLFLHFPSA